jgi:hypothetical protein
MPTADILREKALGLAEAGTATEEAIDELLECCGRRRVPVVLAAEQLQADLAVRGSDPILGRAVELMDATLERLPMM